MMPLACPDQEWRGKNDWDQQFLLGEDLLVAPVAFYGNTRAVWVPAGRWFDVLAGDWVQGPKLVVHEVPPDAVPLFLREGARLTLQPEPGGAVVRLHASATPAAAGPVWTATLGAGSGGDAGAPGADWMALWFGPGLHWTPPRPAD
jgi:alpha-D-xyloside xylohydrolase